MYGFAPREQKEKMAQRLIWMFTHQFGCDDARGVDLIFIQSARSICPGVIGFAKLHVGERFCPIGMPRV